MAVLSYVASFAAGPRLHHRRSPLLSYARKQVSWGFSERWEHRSLANILEQGEQQSKILFKRCSPDVSTRHGLTPEVILLAVWVFPAWTLLVALQNSHQWAWAWVGESCPWSSPRQVLSNIGIHDKCLAPDGGLPALSVRHTTRCCCGPCCGS